MKPHKIFKLFAVIGALSLIFSTFITVNMIESVNAVDIQIPFQGLQIVYETDLPVLSIEPVSSFHGEIACLFDEVSESTSKLTLEIQGTMTSGQTSQSMTLKRKGRK